MATCASWSWLANNANSANNEPASLMLQTRSFLILDFQISRAYVVLPVSDKSILAAPFRTGALFTLSPALSAQPVHKAYQTCCTQRDGHVLIQQWFLPMISTKATFSGTREQLPSSYIRSTCSIRTAS